MARKKTGRFDAPSFQVHADADQPFYYTGWNL